MTPGAKPPPTPGHAPLREAVAAPRMKAAYTRWVFATIADRYDVVNVLLSFNRDRAWKRRMVERVGVKAGERALDLACGTGDIAFRLGAAGARVTGLDITPRMIELALQKIPSPGSPTREPTSKSGAPDVPRFLVGDMMALPFSDDSFDIVTTGYGLRNVPDMRGALLEIRRVLKPAGRLFSLDFNRPSNWLVRSAYLAYLGVVGSAFGWALHGKPTTYRYIPETIRLHPGGTALARLIASTGFEQVIYRPVFGGFMALHAASKPGAATSRQLTAEGGR
ncbi:MAG: ubiquinone/menaquinone biosynthesis methyltransferase [Bacteroidales bacterium]